MPSACMQDHLAGTEKLTAFDRSFTSFSGVFSHIGGGWIGGKAQGLVSIKDILAGGIDSAEFPSIQVAVPTFAVLATDVFDQFLLQNKLHDIAYGEHSNEAVAAAFQQASLPPLIVGDLRALAQLIHAPLAIRSSSLFEDALHEPFAGVYATKMIPNNQLDADTRFHVLLEAIKFVYASTFFKEAKMYIKATGQRVTGEKMAVIIQEVVGMRHGDRFYPHFSGVARSYNFYSTGHGKPRDGVVDLALGLGKTIVDGGRTWSYCPAYPRAVPPFKSMRDMLQVTQTKFWAVNMGTPPTHDPIRETEYMLHQELRAAEEDETLRFVASTYQPENDRLVMGLRGSGPRVVNFAPLLQSGSPPLNPLIRRLLRVCEEAVGQAVEVEFAVTLDPRGTKPAQFGFLQVRPMLVSQDGADVSQQDMESADTLVASERVLGNGSIETIRDIVYMKPSAFSLQQAYNIARDLESTNQGLLEEGRPYLLLVYGRLGTTDPPFGIPVDWWQVAGAKVIVESTLPEVPVELSQGSHFFHNVISLQVGYFSVPYEGKYPIRWEWVQQQPAVAETDFIRHVRLEGPLRVKIDGRTSRGVILK